MFLKTKDNGTGRKEQELSVIAHGFNILGNIVSDGAIDFNGSIDGNIRCHTLTVRANASINGEIMAESVMVYGKVRGLIRAKSVYFYASCNVEGVIMHEAITIEDGASVDGKFKRTNKPSSSDDDFEDNQPPKLLENIRLIG